MITLAGVAGPSRFHQSLLMFRKGFLPRRLIDLAVVRAERFNFAIPQS